MDPSKTHNNSGEQKKPDGVVGRNVAPGTIKECLGNKNKNKKKKNNNKNKNNQNNRNLRPPKHI